MEHLPFIVKKFDSVIILINNLLIWYFQDDFWSSIFAQFDERDRNLDDGQAVIKQLIEVKAKAARQALSPVLKTNRRSPHSNRPQKNLEFKDYKNFEAKKYHDFSITNNNNKNRDQSYQTLDRSSKKNFCQNKEGK